MSLGGRKVPGKDRMSRRAPHGGDSHTAPAVSAPWCALVLGLLCQKGSIKVSPELRALTEAKSKVLGEDVFTDIPQQNNCH